MRTSALAPPALFVAVCLATFFGAAPVALANPDAGSVSIASVVFEGNLPAEAQKIFLERMAEGLAKADVALLGGPRTARPTPCTDNECYRRLAARVGSSYLVVARINESQKNYEIDLELITGATGRSSGYHRQRCQICGLSEAGERMSLAASALTEKLKSLLREPGHVVIRARPATARVIVNGQLKGQSPQEVTLPAGRHKVVLEAPGHRPMEREIEVVPAVDQELLIDMMKIPSEFPYKTAGWSALATGVALIAAGVVTYTYYQGRRITCSDTEKDPYGNCKKILSADWPAASMMAAGASLATFGGVWLYLGAQQDTSGSNNSSTALNVGYSGRF